MKRMTLLLAGLLSLPFFSYSGGIVHNTNQSASWVRMFARDASTDIDAVFYNPAGLTKLGDGFYISLNSQTLFQNREITSSYSNLNNAPVDYEGSVTIPVLPSLYASYNTGKFAFSLGVNVIGGGGTVEFDDGLPSFEIPISDLKALGVAGYNLDAYLEGSSTFWGIQAGASYEINDIFSVYLGARYVIAKNTYEGYLKNVTVDAGVTMPASVYVRGVRDELQATSDDIVTVITGGLDPNTPFTDLEGVATLTSLGLYQTGMTYEDAAEAFGMGAFGMEQKATVLEDQDADIEQTGSGITPIIGVNISPNDKLNIGLKYEFKTKLELENDVPDGKGFLIGFDGLDPVYKYIDGAKKRNDLPALLTIGVDYKISDKFNVSTGGHYYFDKSANYGFKDASGNKIDNSDVFDNNYWEWALGLEYKLTDKLLVSAGYLRAQSGIKEEYQTDMDYKISSNSYGFGGAYSITPNIDFNLAIAYTKYVEDDKKFDYGAEIVTETYNRDNLFFGIGLDFKFGKKAE